MNLTGKGALWVGVMLAAIVTSSNVGALTATDGYLASEPQLYISAYQRSADGQKLSFVQFYNNSDELIDVSTWALYVGEAKPENKLGFAAARDGWLEPGRHAIASLSGVVKGATYQLVSSPVFSAVDKATLTLVPPADSGLRNVVYDLKSTKVSSTVSAYDEIWKRNQTTTGYSSTNTSFTAVPAHETGEIRYEETVNLLDNGLYTVPPAPPLRIVEIYSYASDCDPLDERILCGDYVKLKLDDVSADISSYALRTDSNSASRTASNTLLLDHFQPSASGYITVHQANDGGRISLTNSGGYVWLEDLYGLMQYSASMTHYPSAGASQQGWSYAHNNTDGWQWTTTPRPTSDNEMTAPVVVPEHKPCPAGQYRNPETNRCRTIEEAVNALAACPEGQERNAATNRCRSVLGVSTSLVPCKEGQERNPATNRCRSIASAVAELIPCDEGYERNPATNRCKKVLSDMASKAASAVNDTTKVAGQMNPYLVAAVAGLGVAGYGLYEWRSEAGAGLRRMFRFILRK